MLPLFCVTTGISHRVQPAILVNFPNAVLNLNLNLNLREAPWSSG